ncbi:hypothetical protein EDD11_010280 [Mortierella claussenii]|nr:hypothetical protein EDD11_010280 [Mortierella claussenii]
MESLTDTLTSLSLPSDEEPFSRPATPTGPLPRSLTRPTGWSSLPLECLSSIAAALEDDSTALAAFLQINRQCFFLAVPMLYRDPLQRIRDICRRKSNRIPVWKGQGTPALSSSAQSDEPEHPPTRPGKPLPDAAPTHILTLSQVALRGDALVRMQKSLIADQQLVDEILDEELQIREIKLLCTLFSLYIRDLCVRFPELRSHFYQAFPLFRRRNSFWIEKGPFVFGPHDGTITWPRENYLRHMVALDLEKLSTRVRSSDGPSGWKNMLSARCNKDNLHPTGKEGVFARFFAPCRWEKELSKVGALDYLQRALLNRPGADRIKSLRIPMHRLRTYQQRHERVGRLGRKNRRSRIRTETQKEEMEQSENETVEQGQSRPGATPAAGRSDPPYCFTFNKLTKLRRLEVCGLTENTCDWKTLERVIFTLQRGHHHGYPAENDARNNATHQQQGPRPLNQIREFAIQAQSLLDYRFSRILNYFDHLELSVPPMDLKLDPQLCQHLRVLRMGTSSLFTIGSSRFSDLGRLVSLEELRINYKTPTLFQWIIDAKRGVARCRKLRASQSVPLNIEEDNANREAARARIRQADTTSRQDTLALSNCLPKLKYLGFHASSINGIASVNDAIEAFGDQLEELVLRASSSLEAGRIGHPLPLLTRLAIRGDIILQFDFKSLVENCPTVELLALQPQVMAECQDDDAMVEALVQLPRLRSVFFEAAWQLYDYHLSKLAQESRSLSRIGIATCPNMTLEGIAWIDKMLKDRPSKYPGKQKGLFRLPRTMFNFLSKDYDWRVTFFGHDDD